MSKRIGTLWTIATEIAREYATGEPTTKRVMAILTILQRSQIVTSDFCNWCGHPKREHETRRSVSSVVVGCCTRIGKESWCQCTASRGVVRMPRKVAK